MKTEKANNFPLLLGGGIATRGQCTTNMQLVYYNSLFKKVILLFGISPKTVGWRSSTPVCLPFQFLAYFVSC